MEEAKARRPDIELSGLKWGVTGWVAAANGLRDQKGLNITALADHYHTLIIH